MADSPAEGGGAEMAEPDGAEAKHDRKNDVSGGAEPIAFHGQVERLQAEGRKGGVAAADAGHEGETPFRPNEQPAFRSGVSREEPDDEAAADVHEQGAVRKRFAEAAADDARQPVARDAAERAAAGDEPVIEAMHLVSVNRR